MALGRPSGRPDNPYNKRKRHESDQAKSARIEKMAQTRRAKSVSKKAIAAANKAAAESQKQAAKEKAKHSFFLPRRSSSKSPQETVQVRSDVQLQQNIIAFDEGAQTAAANTVETVNEEPTVDSPEIMVVPALDIIANLHIEDDIEDCTTDEFGEEEDYNSKDAGVQQDYIKAVQMRLRDEVNKNNQITDLWLVNHLKKNGWWIRKEHAVWITKRLNLCRSYSAYYRDVYVWLPDIRWTDVDCKPCCPTCKCNQQVSNYGFHANHFGRLIVGLTETYYIITRRYRCYSCMRKSKDVSLTVDEVCAQADGVSVEKAIDKVQYNFMGWDERILPLYPLGRGDEFPAVLSWKAGVDKKVVSMMRPLFDKGFKPESLSNMLMELHTSEFTKKCIRHEYEIKGRRKMVEFGLTYTKDEPLGDFADKKKYNGVLPSGGYLEHVFVKHHESIRHHLEREVKKRDAEVLMIDVSYKEAKALYQYKGKSVFKGLVTAMNQYGEVRLQFHVYTDSHEQMLAALQAFEKTRTAMGFTGVSHVIGDNPKREASLFMNVMKSVGDQQAKYDSHQFSPGQDLTNTPQYYNSEQLLIKLASGKAEINRVISAMREEIKGGTVGLDAEWNRILNAQGIQVRRGRIQWIQIAYRNLDDKIRVLLLWVGDLKELPNALQDFLCDTEIAFAGNKVSGDIKYIGLDFGVESINSTVQRLRKNVVNLGKFAQVRDVVPTANVSLRQLCELTLGTTIDKTLQTSTWTKDLSDDQKKYIAVDAAVSLEVYEELAKMLDLSARLNEADAKVDAVVDIVPPNGSSVSMATRSATGTIVGTNSTYTCPVGYSIHGKRSVTAGQRMYVVRIDHIHAPGLVIPRYRYKNSKAPVTLADIGLKEILVPLDMLTNHVQREDPPNSEEGRGVTAPALDTAVPSNRRSERGHVPRVRNPIDGYETEAEELEIEQQLDTEWETLEVEIDEAMKDLTSEDIELLSAAVFESIETEKGKVPLRCEGLDDAPSPGLIVNKYSATLGDVFHAINRTKVPVKHEAKKAFFVALREAFLVWNPSKMNELEGRMKDQGMTHQEIQAQKYFNTRFFRECIERKVPPPRILYWRVRAVYALYGPMIDSKTKKPLFGPRAWKKANNVLKEILDGYYSDPPDLELYTKKIGKSGAVLMNKYGLERIECCRGTNRVESYHKNLTVTFGRWNVGIRMSDCLLAERRHRHNQKCSERRRLDYPIIGHYNTWEIDQYQNLVRENHGIQLYPQWTNASDYIDTDESFDTIALQSASLHDKLEQRTKELGPVKLTREQQYICRAMGTSLPFLPFVHEEECKAYARFVLDRKEGDDFETAAEDWMEYVNGVDVMPKLPSHLRTYDESFSRNRRIKESVRKSKNGSQKLEELNDKLSPAAVADDVVGSNWCEPRMPKPMPEPPVQALNKVSFRIIGGIVVGKNPIDEFGPMKIQKRCGVCKQVGCKGLGGRKHCPVMKKRMADSGMIGSQPQKKKPQKIRQCQLCLQHGMEGLNCITGSGNKKWCKYFHVDGNRKSEKGN